jgi:hypothetical protein
MNVNKKVANKKWIICLNDMKSQIDNSSVTNLNAITKKHRTGNQLATMLLRKNIVFKDYLGIYKWNENVEVNNKLIDEYRKFQKMQRKQTQPQLQFDMNYIEIPAEIKAKARAESKTRTTKVKVQQPINIPTQQNEYGLIRKFLKLIWTFLKWLW